MKDPSSRLTQIRLELSEYNFTVEYIKGKDNVGPDAEFSHDFDKKTAKIRTHIISISGLRILHVNLFRKFRKLFTIDFEFVNETINLDYLLSKLEIEANNQELEWPKNGIFFTSFTIQVFKSSEKGNGSRRGLVSSVSAY